MVTLRRAWRPCGRPVAAGPWATVGGGGGGGAAGCTRGAGGHARGDLGVGGGRRGPGLKHRAAGPLRGADGGARKHRGVVALGHRCGRCGRCGLCGRCGRCVSGDGADGGGVVEEDAGVAEGDLVAVVQRLLALDALVVDVGAVERAEVAQHPLRAAQLDEAVLLRDDAVEELDGVVGMTPEGVEGLEIALHLPVGTRDDQPGHVPASSRARPRAARTAREHSPRLPPTRHTILRRRDGRWRRGQGRRWPRERAA